MSHISVDAQGARPAPHGAFGVPHWGPWSSTLGLARSLIGLTTLTSLVFDSSAALFNPYGSPALPSEGVARWGLFSLLGAEHLEMARWIGIASMLLVVSGWRPRYTGVLHWWIAFSYMTASHVVEGGDHIAANLALLLLPVTLTDARRWHWAASPFPVSTIDRLRHAVAVSALPMLRLQMAIVYLHAAIGKMGVTEWADGTALYYWFLHPMFGAPRWLRPLVEPIVENSYLVVLATWSVIVFELLLAAALVMPLRTRRHMLMPGMLFHLGIVFIHGLGSFFFAMAGGLILYLLPLHRTLRVARGLSERTHNWWIQARGWRRPALRGAMPVVAD